MTDFDNAGYYAHREQVERDRAGLISDPLVAGIHREMAEMYRDRAVQEARMSLPIIESVPGQR